jgi:hypothetical protein
MVSKEITLSSGIVVKVVPVPQKAYDVIRMKYPDPPIPIEETSKTATGETMRYENPNDLDYRKELAASERSRQLAWAEAMLLFGLPEVVVPDDWEPPTDDIRYIDPDWSPREGDRGRRLDYIEWELLHTIVDEQKVINAINALSMISEEVVDAIEDSFQGDLEVPGTGKESSGETD